MIDKILQNLFYQGHLTWNVRKSHTNSARKELGQFDLFENFHEPIIPQHLERIVKQMKSFKNQFGRNMDTPFTLKDLLVCKNCDVPLISKNFTPGKSKREKLVYRCVNCKKYVEVKKVHEIVLKKFFEHISKNSAVMKREVISTLKSWKKILKQKQDNVHKTLQHVKEQERYVLYSTNLAEREFANSIAITQNFLSEKGTELGNLLDQIEQILDGNELETLFSRFFDLKNNSLSELELRSLSLFFIEKVELNLSTTNVAIQYKLTPFVDLEKWISQTTADLAM
ncbi:recombinase family protein [Neobacillus niacini]|uniref:recombinase family protein n=1 Tax=Neobacillus niacini TaxID=86668 RepID=UPI002FFDB473